MLWKLLTISWRRTGANHSKEICTVFCKSLTNTAAGQTAFLPVSREARELQWQGKFSIAINVSCVLLNFGKIQCQQTNCIFLLDAKLSVYMYMYIQSYEVIVSKYSIHSGLLLVVYVCTYQLFWFFDCWVLTHFITFSFHFVFSTALFWWCACWHYCSSWQFIAQFLPSMNTCQVHHCIHALLSIMNMSWYA